MVIAGGDYVHFFVEYGGKIEKCRVTEAALLTRELMSRKDAGYAQLIAIFVRHRAEIEHLALAKLQREGHSDRGVVVTWPGLSGLLSNLPRLERYYFECAYTSLPQCNASACGRAAQSIINPYYAGRKTAPPGRRDRRHRRVY